VHAHTPAAPLCLCLGHQHFHLDVASRAPASQLLCSACCAVLIVQCLFCAQHCALLVLAAATAVRGPRAEHGTPPMAWQHAVHHRDREALGPPLRTSPLSALCAGRQGWRAIPHSLTYLPTHTAGSGASWRVKNDTCARCADRRAVAGAKRVVLCLLAVCASGMRCAPLVHLCAALLRAFVCCAPAPVCRPGCLFASAWWGCAPGPLTPACRFEAAVSV
jgi:hypothetical protein